MEVPFPECGSCIATPFCQIYAGAVPKKRSSFCSAKLRLDVALQLSRIPLRYQGADRYRYQVDEQNSMVYERMYPYLDHILQTVNDGKNFFFYSQYPGTGKTYLASVFLNHYIYKACLTDKFDFEHPLALFVVYSNLMDDLRYRRDEERTVQLMDKVRDVPFLLLDDVGSGTVSDFVREQTYLILNHRFNSQLSTVLTSNYGFSELEMSLGARNVSRILAECDGSEIKGRDRRRGG